MNDVFPVSLVSNVYLDELTSTVRQKQLSWEDYRNSELVTEEEYQILKSYHTSSAETRAPLPEVGAVLVGALVNLVDKVAKVESLQQLLVVADDILDANENNAIYFHQTCVENPKYPFSPFLKCLSKDDDFIALKSSKILTTLLCTADSDEGVDLRDFFQWIAAQLQSKNISVSDIAVQNLESLLKVSAYRRRFYETRNGVSSLLDLLKRNNNNPQMQYQVIFCFWLLSFEKSIAGEIGAKYDVIPIFIDVAKASVKEKVIRVIISTFKNLIEKAPEENMASMLVHKLLNFSENLATRKWSDPDIIEDIEFLKSQLEENFQSLTTWDEYIGEVESGKLSWSPPHQSQQFWTQNSARFNENDHELLRRLGRLLATSTDPIVLAVASHDIGQYVKHYVNGKRVVQEIGAKQRIMELMTHENPEVRYQALLAVQKLMTNAWE
ncbi:ATPase, V1 complex, subunit H [Basidiobolus meristosporus CBS 931.73]|uniref:V-type proton ATPase subunit H n=1 Tax=Basidiobolus meristosporus CBS 931.73 TaxID=1314790 RepID=A0A1Y1X7J3_9FUNG|nr:ATPase, V1 complex, subunit H [Basidiobolus meristosporus CBS 931.73]|eukprot:ORX81668.1 ATPase, V1 complex, subunit H [Basidiobolus meristosporus CBS 931.73]